MGIAINTPGQKPDLRMIIIIGVCAALATLFSSCSASNTATSSYSNGGPASPYAGAVSVSSSWSHKKDARAFSPAALPIYKNGNAKRK